MVVEVLVGLTSCCDDGDFALELGLETAVEGSNRRPKRWSPYHEEKM